MKLRVIGAAIALSLMALGSSAVKAADYPDRPISVMVSDYDGRW